MITVGELMRAAMVYLLDVIVILDTLPVKTSAIEKHLFFTFSQSTSFASGVGIGIK